MPVTNYIWDVATDSYLMETDENDATTAVYTHGPGPYGNLVSQRRDGASSFYHYDGLGSTDRLTDAGQAVTDQYVYTAYGKLISATGSTVNPFRWIGQLGYYFDTALDTFYIRARVYDPTTGRWVSQDPIGFQGGFNVYLYVSARPVLRVDPLGYYDAGKNPNEIEPVPVKGPLDQVHWECCNEWYEKMQKRGRHPWGATMCCNGEFLRCIYKENIRHDFKRQVDKDAMSIIMDCVGLHESTHVSQLECVKKRVSGCKYVEQTRPIKGFEDPYLRECKAFEAELKCLKENRKKCNSVASCERDVDGAIKRAQTAIRICKVYIVEDPEEHKD